jgi:glycosyltransferase involved in cell wall biosynthesis
LTQKALASVIYDFRPEAILTVVHGYSWKSAVKLARKLNLPYHLIIHDDWDKTFSATEILMPLLQRQFSNVYRNAASRLCISPYMAQCYREKYGVSGDVLYPMRAVQAAEFGTPSPRSTNREGFTVAFAGSINSLGYVNALRRVAEALEAVGGKLALFGPLSSQDAQKIGLNSKNITLRGWVSSDDLPRIFRNEVDALIVAMSFDPTDRRNMELAFPSKLADYTGIGLPIIIFGPRYSSAVRWAAEFRDVAEVIDCDDSEYLATAIARLACDPQRRIKLSRRALEVGEICFSHEAAQRKFFATITGNLTRVN